MNDLLVIKQSKCNGLQGEEQGLVNKAKDFSFKSKDWKIVLKDSLRSRPRTPITDCESVTVCFSIEWLHTFLSVLFQLHASHPSTADCSVVSSTRYDEAEPLKKYLELYI